VRIDQINRAPPTAAITTIANNVLMKDRQARADQLL
jgi:hypothetical protein